MAPPPLGESPNDRIRTLAEVEREHILSVLKNVEGNRSEAARLLGIGRNTLARKLREFG
jgi:DNA-binding NtrC family response regulator